MWHYYKTDCIEEYHECEERWNGRDRHTVVVENTDNKDLKEFLEQVVQEHIRVLELREKRSLRKKD